MISIIITAYREERTIGRAVDSFSSIKNKEIIVVAPDKKTLDAAKKHKVKTIKDKGNGKPSALNLAFSKAKGNILILTDGDVYTENATALLRHFKEKDVGAVCGKVISLNKKDNMLGYWSHLLTGAAHKERLTRKGKYIDCSGYIYAIKNIIKDIPTDCLADDAVISQMIHKKGYKIIYEPKAKAYVRYPDNYKEWIAQKYRSAGGYVQLGKYFKNPAVMRSFSRELMGLSYVLGYAGSIKEIWWSICLLFARLYLWLKIFFVKKSFKHTWVRINSTK